MKRYKMSDRRTRFQLLSCTYLVTLVIFYFTGTDTTPCTDQTNLDNFYQVIRMCEGGLIYNTRVVIDTWGTGDPDVYNCTCTVTLDTKTATSTTMTEVRVREYPGVEPLVACASKLQITSNKTKAFIDMGCTSIYSALASSFDTADMLTLTLSREDITKPWLSGHCILITSTLNSGVVVSCINAAGAGHQTLFKNISNSPGTSTLTQSSDASLDVQSGEATTFTQSSDVTSHTYIAETTTLTQSSDVTSHTHSGKTTTFPKSSDVTSHTHSGETTTFPKSSDVTSHTLSGETTTFSRSSVATSHTHSGDTTTLSKASDATSHSHSVETTIFTSSSEGAMNVQPTETSTHAIPSTEWTTRGQETYKQEQCYTLSVVVVPLVVTILLTIVSVVGHLIIYRRRSSNVNHPKRSEATEMCQSSIYDSLDLSHMESSNIYAEIPNWQMYAITAKK